MTCKRFRALGSEFLFRCLFFNNPSNLLALCAILDSSASSATTLTASFGWWTRRIHLTRYYASAATNTTLLDLENALVSIIRHCPNLEIFIVDWPLRESFGAIADALATYPCRRSLRTVHWAVGADSVAKVIWALDCLPYIVALHVEFAAPPGIEDYDLSTPLLGSASGLRLSLPRLQQLSLRGYAQEFIDQATSWSLPSLRSFSLTTTTTGTPLPDIPLFLTHHGLHLLFLDLNTLSMLDLPTILDLCPSLNTLTFNPDWRLRPPAELDGSSHIVNRPHPGITTIGLHGLLYAFGVGYAAEYASTDPLTAQIIRRSNDMNVSALTLHNFPSLKRVRALGRGMLLDLNKADGPNRTEDGGAGFERWSRWWGMCVKAGVRLEDCTGGLLGVLPEDERDESDSEEGEDSEEEEDSEEDEDSDEDEDEWNIEIPPMPEEPNDRTAELRQLLEECRAMSEGREESMFGPMMGMGGMGMMGMGMGPMGMMGMGPMGMGGMGMGMSNANGGMDVALAAMRIAAGRR